MRIPFTHPSLHEISAFAAGELPSGAHATVAAHLRQCAQCQDSLRYVHRIALPAHQPLPDADRALLDRIQRSRADGERVILPVVNLVTPATSEVPSLARRVGLWTVAAGLLAALGLSRVFTPEAAHAAGGRSTLTFSPRLPVAGAEVTVRYTPARGTFSSGSALRLRARLRTAVDEAYTVPPSRLRVLGTMRRERDGSYTARFTLPDSIVYAVVAVEDTGAAHVDDNVGQGWELTVASIDGRPLFDALYQRAHDMMGRSWQDAYASAQRATTLYPDSIRGWTYRQFFEGELFSGAAGDSIRRVRDATIDALVMRAKQAEHVNAQAIGAIYYRSYRRAHSPGASSADSAEWQYWWSRMVREYPQHEQAAQRLALWMDVKALGPAASLDSLDHLFSRFASLQAGPSLRNLVMVGADVASRLGDAQRTRVWMERTWIGAPDSARRAAVWLSTQPASREEGLSALRTLLAQPTFAEMVVRPLGRNAQSQERAVADLRRATLAAVGRALLAQGRTHEALDTLKRAADGGWDPTLFRELSRSYVAAGDTLDATTMQARLVVDGRGTEALRDSLTRIGSARVGAARWTRLLDDARREMHARLLERSISRGIASTASVQSRDGTAHTLRSLLGGRPGVVIFWSRNCGYALDALPEIRTLVARLRASGTPIVFAVDESPSPAFDRMLAEQRITWPVYYDVGTTLGDAMRNFGTPHYYVLDRAGRIRFSGVEEIADLHTRLAAVASADETAARSSAR